MSCAHRVRSLIAALCCLAPQTLATRQSVPASAVREDPAARAGELELSWSEFDALVLDRHASTEVGRSALKHLLRAELLDKLATESKLAIAPAEVEAKLREIEADVVARGQAPDLDQYLRKNRIDRATFREFLRLGLVQEELARQALGVPKGKPVNAEKQEMWLDQVIEQRGTQYLPAPWKDGVAARCGDLEVPLRDYLAHLKRQLVRDDIQDDCYEALLAKRVRARMPDLSAEAFARALDQELARRRAAIGEDPKFKGLAFEQMLAAQGLTLDVLRRDPAVVTSALAFLWIELKFGEDGLKKVYADERESFDARYGEARDLRVIYLRGAKFANQLNPRTFEDAERELEKFKLQATSRELFERLARTRSEDPATRERGGSLGFISPGDETLPAPIREAVFSGPKIDGEHLVGPVRLAQPSGALLVWVGERRPAPGWDEMRSRVHNELRRRFLDESLPKTDVVTYLDRD